MLDSEVVKEKEEVPVVEQEEVPVVGCWGAVAADLRRSLTAPPSRHFIITMRQACATSSAAHAQSALAPTTCASHRSSTVGV